LVSIFCFKIKREKIVKKNPYRSNKIFVCRAFIKNLLQAAGIFSLLCVFSYVSLSATKPDATFRGTAYSVAKIYGVAVLPDGKRYIGGRFIEVGGNTSCVNIARLNADGTLDTTFAARADNWIYKVVPQPDGKVLVGGFFENINGAARASLARLNADGTLDTSFTASSTLTGFTSTSDLVLQPDGKIIIIKESARDILRLNNDGTLDASFNVGSGPRFQGGAGTIAALALQPDGKIIVTGTFDTFNTTPRNFVVRLNADGSVDSGFNQANNAATVPGNALLTLADGKILFAGESFLRKLNTDGTIDPLFNPTFTAPQLRTNLLQQPDGKLIVSSYRTGGDQQDVNFDSVVARYNLEGTTDAGFTTLNAADSLIAAIALQPDNQIFVGGTLFIVGGQQRFGNFSLNPNGNLNAAFAPIVKDSATISDIALEPNGKIIIGGSFFEVNGIQRNNLARLNANGTVDTAFNPNVESLFADSPPYFSAVRRVVRLADGKIVFGGRFYRVGGAVKRQIVRLNNDGSVDIGFNLPANTVISAFQAQPLVVQTDGKIITNGGTLSGGLSTWRVIRLNTDGSLDTSFTNGARGLAVELAVAPTGSIYAGGFFLSSPNEVVRVKNDGSLDTTFNGPASGGGLNLVSMALQTDGKILIGRAVGNPLVRLNQNGSLDASFTPSLLGDLYPQAWRILPQTDGKIIVGGDFTQANGIRREGLVKLNADGTTDESFQPNGLLRNGFPLAFAVKTNGNIVFGGTFEKPNGVRQSIGQLLRNSASADFDGDGNTDVAVFRPSEGNWYSINSSDNTFQAQNFGLASDKIVPADYDGDGRTDTAIFRAGIWYIRQSSNGLVAVRNFGLSDDIPVPADYDADGLADTAVYRSGIWYILQSSNGGFRAVQFGIATDKPVPADYDGDGKTDFAVYRGGIWYILQSANGFRAETFGLASDTTAQADFDGDGAADLAVYRGGVWYIRNSRDASFRAESFGLPGDNLTAGDYDGDNQTDVAVWRPSSATFFALRSSNRIFTAQTFGLSSDLTIAGR
jgi:uncharacterized delta-60 repeat protein